MAQLGARLDGIEEVVGSNPIGSTNFIPVYYLCILQSETNGRFTLAKRRTYPSALPATAPTTHAIGSTNSL